MTYLIFNNLLNYSLNNSASQSVGLSARLLVGLSVGWLIDQSTSNTLDIITQIAHETTIPKAIDNPTTIKTLKSAKSICCFQNNYLKNPYLIKL